MFHVLNLLLRIVVDPVVLASELYIVKEVVVIRICCGNCCHRMLCYENYHLCFTCSCCYRVTVPLIVVSDGFEVPYRIEPSDTTLLW
jgi:hypothetical protein